ncbi:uncharacterized protein LOC135495021 [Lineus longissimus]|uniref:uncharacterized protein LOC135495021 n=1 Tax=Lineus longissimus TaxID=88925 RepID=UPI002B4E123B
MNEASGLDHLPDDILLHVFKLVSKVDLFSVSQVNERFHHLTSDSSLVRSCDFTGDLHHEAFQWFKTATKATGHYVQRLCMNQMFWIPQQKLYPPLARCRNLVELHVIGTSICSENVGRLLQKMDPGTLHVLALSIEHLADLSTDIFRSYNVLNVARYLRALTLDFRHRRKCHHHGRGATAGEGSLLQRYTIHIETELPEFLSACRRLVRLDLSSVNDRKELIANPALIMHDFSGDLEDLCSLTELSLQVLCYHNSEVVKFHTWLREGLLRLGVHFKGLVQGPTWVQSYRDAKCLSDTEFLKRECLKIFPQVPQSSHTDLGAARNLTCLIIMGSIINNSQVRLIAENCVKLESVNFSQCQDVFLEKSSDHLHPGDEIEPGVHRVDICGFQLLIKNCTDLRHVNISGISVYNHIKAKELFESLSEIKGLLSLSISTSLLGAVLGTRTRRGSTMHSLTDGFGPGPRKRIAHRRHADATGGPFDEFVSQTPHMEEFEILSTVHETDSLIHECGLGCFHASSANREDWFVTDQDIACVSKWGNLKSLTLSGLLGLSTGSCLMSIAAGCPKLQRLFIDHIGPTGKCIYELALLEALQHCHNLLDLRIEQPHFRFNRQFGASLQKSSQLRRLCLMGRDSIFDEAAVAGLFEGLPDLVSLQLFPSVSQKVCKQLKDTLTKRWQPSCPALSIAISSLSFGSSLDDTCLEKELWGIPDIHLKEMVNCASRVATVWPKRIGEFGQTTQCCRHVRPVASCGAHSSRT